MQDIVFTEEEAMLADAGENFLKEKCTFAHVRRVMEEERGFDPALWEEIVNMGWTGLALPPEWGGAGLGLGAAACLAEAMGQYLLPSPFLSTTLAGQLLLLGGTQTQKDAWLGKLASGAARGAVALDDSFSWSAQPVEARAHASGAGYVLDGCKTGVMDAQGADVILVAVDFLGEPAVFAIESGELQGRITQEKLLDETRRCFRLDLQDLRLKAEARLAEENAFHVLLRTHAAAWLLLAADMTGAANGAFELTLDYARTRKQFGKLIGSYQGVKHPLAEAMVSIETARSLVYHAKTVFDEDAKTRDIACRMAKAYAEEAAAFMADRAIQFHGGMGFTHECHAQLFYKRIHFDRFAFGDALHHRSRLAELLFA